MENIIITNELHKIVLLCHLPPQQFFVIENNLFQVKDVENSEIEVLDFGPIKQNMTLKHNESTNLFDGYTLVMPVKVTLTLTFDIDACNSIFKL